ncbi:MAG: STAS domain-containing protein [Treponema sp.]|nr:STAS domain-containing protein [Treponema sp.]
MHKDDFRIDQEKHEQGVRYILRGKLNSTSAANLEQALNKSLAKGDINISLNMLRVSYLSSTGIRVLLKSYKEAFAAGGKLRIEGPSENVRNVLGMTALDKLLMD